MNSKNKRKKKVIGMIITKRVKRLINRSKMWKRNKKKVIIKWLIKDSQKRLKKKVLSLARKSTSKKRFLMKTKVKKMKKIKSSNKIWKEKTTMNNRENKFSRNLKIWMKSSSSLSKKREDNQKDIILHMDEKISIQTTKC